MPPRLEDEDQDKRKNNEQKKEDALPPARILLVPVERGIKKRDQTLIAIDHKHVTAQTELRFRAPSPPRPCGRPSAQCCIRRCQGVCPDL